MARKWRLEVKKFNENNQELAIRFGLGAIKAVGVGAMESLVDVRSKHNQDFQDIYDFSSKAGSKILNKKSVEALAKAGAFDSIHQNRNQIFESCDIICKYGISKEQEDNSSQMSLFGGSSLVQIENPSLKQVDDWTKDEKLQKEFEAFGFFVNEHPLDDYLLDLKKRGVISSEILNEDIVSDNSIIKIAGVVAYSRHRSGPKGRYAYLILSDPIGIFETSIFDENLITDSRDLMESGQSLVLVLLVRKDDGGTRLLVREIIKLEDFIKDNSPKKEEFMDIKTLPKRDGNFDWASKNRQNSPKDDKVVLEIEYKRKIEELKNKSFFKEVVVDISDRNAIFNIKSLLSQKLAPEGLENVTRVYITSGDTKIELSDKYIIGEQDCEKISLIPGASIKLSN